MPLYAWKCGAGHETLRFFHVHDRRPKAVRCGTCRRRAHRVFSATVRPDMPAHFSPTFGEPVRNRRHFHELQEKHGTRDYEPIRHKDDGLHEAGQYAERHDADEAR